MLLESCAGVKVTLSCPQLGVNPGYPRQELGAVGVAACTAERGFAFSGRAVMALNLVLGDL